MCWLRSMIKLRSASVQHLAQRDHGPWRGLLGATVIQIIIYFNETLPCSTLNVWNTLESCSKIIKSKKETASCSHLYRDLVLYIHMHISYIQTTAKADIHPTGSHVYPQEKINPHQWFLCHNISWADQMTECSLTMQEAVDKRTQLLE